MGVRAYARTPIFGFPLEFREVLIMGIQEAKIITSQEIE